MPARSRIDLRAELPVLIALFLDLTAFGMVFPDVQLHARALGASGPIIGALLASMFVIQMLASPPWGKLSDRIGRKTVFGICTALSASSWLVYAFSSNLWLILLSRVLAGIAAANVVAAQAYLADISSPDDRSGAMGRSGAAISGGLILGPALGMQLVAMGNVRLLGIVAATLSTIAVISGLFMAHSEPAKTDGEKSKFGLNLSILKDVPPLFPLVLLATVAWFALATLEGTFGRLITEFYHYPATIFGDIFSMESLIGAVVQGLLVAVIVSRLRLRWMLRLGFLLTGLGLLLTPFAPAIWLLFVFSAIYAIGSALSNPSLNSAASGLVPQERQGELFGLLQGSRSIGFLFGPLIGGALFDWRAAAPYVLAGAVGLLASALVPPVESTGTNVKTPS